MSTDEEQQDLQEQADQQERLGRLAVELESHHDVVTVLNRVVQVAVDEVAGAEMAGVTILDEHGSDSPAISDPLVARVDALQYGLDEGPCLEAAHDGPVVRSADLRRESRWPAFSRQAADLGVVSMLSVQLFVTSGTIGALNMYARRPDAFDWDSEHLAVPLAMHAAAAVGNVRTAANLRIAIASRDVIGQAKGILMERFKVSEVAAFDMLITASHDQHRKLREVAEDLAATGAFEQSTEPEPEAD